MCTARVAAAQFDGLEKAAIGALHELVDAGALHADYTFNFRHADERRKRIEDWTLSC